MDHHDWADWSEDDGGLGEHDTADLGTPDHFDGLGGHDHVESFDADHDGYPDAAQPPQPDLGHGPDLLHESGDLDVPQHDPDPGLDHPDPGQHGHYDDVPADEPGHGTGGEHVEHLVDHPVGTDPDVDDHHDGVWHDDEFPPQLDLDARPEPADGYPWVDPDTLGDPGTVPDADHVEVGLGGGAPVGDLFAYAGLDAAPAGVDPWSLLLGSDDPATSTLARWWGPAG
jgi:hypothetical protein